MRDWIPFVQGFNWESENQEDWDLLDSYLKVLCPQLDDCNAQFSRLIGFLNEKVALAEHPDVIKGIFDGDTEMPAIIEQMRTSQKRLLDSEKASYRSLCVTQ